MIYLTGYYSHTPSAIKRLAETLDATVADIRYRPFSRIPGWSNAELAELLGERYIWIESFGNLNYNTGGMIAIANMQAGVQTLIKHGRRNYILLCGCKDAATCHRMVVGDHLRGLSKDGVREITPEEWAAAGQVAVTDSGGQLGLFVVGRDTEGGAG